LAKFHSSLTSTQVRFYNTALKLIDLQNPEALWLP